MARDSKFEKWQEQQKEKEKESCPFKPKVNTNRPTKQTFEQRSQEYEDRKREKLERMQKNIDKKYSFTPLIKEYKRKPKGDSMIMNSDLAKAEEVVTFRHSGSDYKDEPQQQNSVRTLIPNSMESQDHLLSSGNQEYYPHEGTQYNIQSPGADSLFNLP